jgi:hypothetical protein
MRNYSDVKSIIDSFRFYIMFYTYIGKDNFILGNKKIQEFKKELKENGIKKEIIESCIHQASVSLPPDFNYLNGLENFNYRERY